MKTPLRVYFAGELFDHKDLIGNALLASHIEKQSRGQLKIILPQDFNNTGKLPEEIRDQNLRQLIQCDLALFNFDGLELDSGTVVEFVFAKAVDMPSVILRSDLRQGGDQDSDGDDWNLMCSFFPRTEIVTINALALYQQIQAGNGSLDETINQYYSGFASRLIDGLNSVRETAPLHKTDQAQLVTSFQWALTFPGGQLAQICSDPPFIEDLVRAKIEKGLL